MAKSRGDPSPPAALVSAGVNKNSGSDSLTLDDKQLLNAYLKKKNGNDGGTISIRRKKTEVSTVGGVKVERKRGRAVTIPSPEELAAEAKAKAVAEAQKAEQVEAKDQAAEQAKAEAEAAARAEARAKAEAEAAKLKAAKAAKAEPKAKAEEAKPVEAAEKPAEVKAAGRSGRQAGFVHAPGFPHEHHLPVRRRDFPDRHLVRKTRFEHVRHAPVHPSVHRSGAAFVAEQV